MLKTVNYNGVEYLIQGALSASQSRGINAETLYDFGCRVQGLGPSKTNIWQEVPESGVSGTLDAIKKWAEQSIDAHLNPVPEEPDTRITFLNQFGFKAPEQEEKT